MLIHTNNLKAAIAISHDGTIADVTLTPWKHSGYTLVEEGADFMDAIEILDIFIPENRVAMLHDNWKILRTELHDLCNSVRQANAEGRLPKRMSKKIDKADKAMQDAWHAYCVAKAA